MRKIDEIIIHCSATKPSMDIGADTIRRWHVEGNGCQDIGYHYVIRRDGEYETGRPVQQTGAHCRGHNAHSIGVCLVGGIDDSGTPEDNFMHAQYDSLAELLRILLGRHKGITKISGHRDYSNKACPSFDVQEFLKKAGIGV